MSVFGKTFKDEIACQSASQVRDFILQNTVADGHLVKNLSSFAVDGSLVALATPYRVFDTKDPVFLNTTQLITRQLVTPVGGVRRYLEDTYYGGGVWVILSAWLGWFLAEAGQTEDAETIRKWIEERASPTGELPEQFAEDLNAPEFYFYWVGRWGPIASPLLWSHAMYLISEPRPSKNIFARAGNWRITIEHIPSWIADAIFYQIFPDRFYNGDPDNDPPDVRPWGDLPTTENFFGGDLQGILNKLDYLQDLGINALYVNPIFAARTNHKYDTRDYFLVDPAFGDNFLLKRLISACHERGMRVILDGVFNHCGLDFFAFQDLLKNGAASEYVDWFIVLSFPLQDNPLSYLVCGGAHYLPKLNTRHRPVQEYILKVARYWLESAGIDGWRLDVPFKIPFPFWREFRQVVKKINPEAYLIGEIWRDAGPWVGRGTSTPPGKDGGLGQAFFDGVTNYRLRELILDYVAREILDGEDFSFELALLRQSLGPAQFGMLNLLGSHDTPRILTLLKGDLDRLRIALTFLFTTPGAPLIYYGDEVGMTGEHDPDCRRPMVWDRERQNRQIFDFIQRLIAIRKSHPSLRYGETETLFTANGVYIYRQHLEEDEVLVLLNPREGVHHLNFPTHSQIQNWADPFQDGHPQVEETLTFKGGMLSCPYLPACTAKVLLPRR